MISNLDALIARAQYAYDYYWGYHDCGHLMREAATRIENLSTYRAHALAYEE